MTRTRKFYQAFVAFQLLPGDPCFSDLKTLEEAREILAREVTQ
jgi:hypothetical protein